VGVGVGAGPVLFFFCVFSFNFTVKSFANP